MMEEIVDGIKKAVLLEKSGVKKVFTPHTPVKTYQNLIGRADLSQQLIQCLISTGRHALLYGDRGVGKSSLANASTDLIIKKIYKGDVFKKSCDSTDKFSSLFEQPLRKAGVNIELLQSSNETELGAEGGASLKYPGLEAQGKVSARKKQSATIKYDYNIESPSWVGSKIKDLNCLIVIDEFDAIKKIDEKYKVAELIKYLSDNSESVTILLVGIAKSAVELTSGHPSVRRCLLELHVGRMSELELKKILLDGSQKLGLIFQDDVINEIVSIIYSPNCPKMC
jgi:Cdc6-like AAA superfamily ATPase